jgi:hypothetical protein
MQYLLTELRQGFRDTRQKVIEEGWFGRVVTAAPVVEADRDAFYGANHLPLQAPGDGSERRPTFDELWKPREVEQGIPDKDRERQAPLNDERGLDR